MSISRQDYGYVFHHSAIKYGFLKMNNRSQKHIPLINNLKTLYIQYVITEDERTSLAALSLYYIMAPSVLNPVAIMIFSRCILLSRYCTYSSVNLSVLCSGGVFLACVGTAGVIAGFGSSLAMAKKKCPEWFSKVSGFLNWKNFLHFYTRMPYKKWKNIFLS